MMIMVILIITTTIMMMGMRNHYNEHEDGYITCMNLVLGRIGVTPSFSLTGSISSISFKGTQIVSECSNVIVMMLTLIMK